MTEETNNVAVVNDATTQELIRTREVILKSTVETMKQLFGQDVALVLSGGLAVTTGDQLATWKFSAAVLNSLIEKKEAELAVEAPVEAPVAE